ncbi:MAG: putative membrane protein [Alphaproteobacteria bacterium]|jgi:uncharacterized membrane protein
MNAALESQPFRLPTIKPISGEDPWRWLALGWLDLSRHSAISLGYGVVFTLCCYGIAALLLHFDLLALAIPVAAALVFAGPLLAIGLYELSRRISSGEAVTVGKIAFVRTPAPAQIAFIGLVLALFALAWIRIATLLFALFFGESHLPLAELMRTLLLTLDGLSFLVVGSLIGAGLAFLAFSISAVSIPRLVDRETDAITAIATSIMAVRRNFWPMLLWAWIIGVLTAIAIATLCLGFIVIFPLVGHATWHAYKALVEDN